MGRSAVWMGVAFAAAGCTANLSQSRRQDVPADASPSRGTVAAQPDGSSRETAIAAARALLGKARIQIGRKSYPNDCTGLVRAVFDQVGVNLFENARRGDNGVTAIYRFAESHGRIYTGGRPVAGDLVFFHDTYDQNRDGRRNHGLTHVALVEQVEDDRTVWIIHRVRRGVVRYRMNLDRPDVRLDKSGRVLNDYLRVATPRNEDVLTAQLFAAYATVLPGGVKPLANASDSTDRYAGQAAELQLSRKDSVRPAGGP